MFNFPPRRLSRSVKVVSLTAAGALSLAPAVAQRPYGPKPTGLVAVLVNDPSKPLDLTPVSNPYVSGVAIQIHWADLEPARGQPDWTRLDQLFSAALASNKWVQLLIFPGFFSPSWALDGVHWDKFPIQYGPGVGDIEPLPMPWDPVYLSNWFAFVKRLSQRYGNNPALRAVAAAGPTSVSDEFTLPPNNLDVLKWEKDGYTPTKYLAAWEQTFLTYKEDFPNRYISLSLGDGIAVDDQGQLDPSEPLTTQTAVINEAASILQSQFMFQESNLDGNAATATSAQTETVRNLSGQFITGYQLRTNCINNSANMGAAGNPPLALLRSVDNGMQPNENGQRADYIEIYYEDVEAATMQTALQYAASFFTR